MYVKRRNRSSRVFAILLALMMTLVYVPTFSYAAEGDGITVYMTVSNQGQLATANDGSVMAWKEVKVTDIDNDGQYTFDEALVAAHAAYNSADGYSAPDGSVKKLWGVETSNVLFFVNDEGLSTGVSADTVSDGDYCAASVNADQTYYADWYTFFDQRKVEDIHPGDSVTLNLQGHLGMAYTDADKVNTAISGVAVMDAAGNTIGTTDDEGNITVSFDQPGTYILTANGTKSAAVSDFNLMNYKTMDSTVDGTAFVKFDWDTYDSFVAYTDADYGEGPYPASEVKYIDFMEEADEESENEYAWEDLHYLTSNRVITDCPIIAPVCVVNVTKVPASEIEYTGDAFKFVKEDLESAFGMWRIVDGPVITLSEDESEVTFTYKTNNTATYAGFYLDADIELPDTWKEDNYIAMGDDNMYSFTLDASYCGKAWPVAPVKKTDMTATTSTQYYLAIPSVDDIRKADPANVTVTVNNKGVIAEAKDGSAMVEKKVKVIDLDKDGHLTYAEALTAAHEKYFEGGADGFAMGDPYGYGLACTKLWGVDTTNTLFYTNGEGLATGVADDEVAEGDDLYASVNADDANYADWQTRFDVTDSGAVAYNQEVTLTLTGRLGMAYTAEEKEWKPLEGVQIGLWKDGAFEPIEGAVTDANGQATFVVPAKGKQLLTAKGTVPGTDWNGNAIDCPTMAPYSAVQVGTAPENITVTVNNKGILAQAKDGSAMVEKPVAVIDLNMDGELQVDEALVALHDLYFEGGAAAGYSQGEAFSTKLWGVSTTNNLYFVNDSGITSGVTVDTVKSGDKLYASVNADDATYSDWYTRFDKTDIAVREGMNVTLTLTGHLGMGYDEETTTFVPLEGIQLGAWSEGTFYPIDGAVTDENGQVTLPMPEVGRGIITAQGTIPSVVTDWNLMGLGGESNPYGTIDTTTYESMVAYTDADYGEGPYPAEEIKYIDFFEEADEDSDNDYAWQDLHYLKSNQVIKGCPIMAPYCDLEVSAESKIDNQKQEATNDVIGSTDLNEYRTAEQIQILSLMMKTQVAISMANSTDEIDGLVADFKAQVAEIKTDAQYTAEETTAKIEAVEAAKIAGLKVTAGDKKATVSWTKNAKVTGYEISYTKAGGTEKTVKATSAATVKKTISKLAAAKYTFKVRGYLTIDGTTYYSKWSDAKTVTIPSSAAVKAAKITGVKAKAGSKKATISWTKNTKMDGYEISYKQKGASSSKTVKVTKQATVKKTISSLKAGKSYTFKVRGYKKIDGKTYYSKWSVTKTVTIKK